jgi:hypothetical protein
MHGNHASTRRALDARKRDNRGVPGRLDGLPKDRQTVPRSDLDDASQILVDWALD